MQISNDTNFYAVCSLLPALIVNPNGGSWNEKTERQSFYQADGTTMNISNPTNLTHTITYEDNGQEAAFISSPSSATAEFTNWTLSGGGSWDTDSKIYTFGLTNGTLTANYKNTTIELPNISKNNHTCKWAKNSTTGTQYIGGAEIVITSDTKFYAICTINPKLTVDPNGGNWNNSTSTQDFYQVAGTTKTINNPIGPEYSISYNGNSQEASYTESPTKANAIFNSWSINGGGSFTDNSYTFGTSNGTLTANYDNASFMLPSIDKTGHICQWAIGSTTGTKYDSGARVTIPTSSTFFAICTPKSYTITLDSNGATTSGSGSTSATYGSIELGNITNPQRQYAISGFSTPNGNNAANANVSSTSTITAKSNFDGWYENSGATTKIASNSTTPILQANTSYTNAFGQWTKDGGVTLYAGWTSQPVTLPTISKTGHDCGWTTLSTGATSITYASGNSITPSSDITLYGVCKVKSYNLTIDPNGGTWNSSTSSIVITNTYGSTDSIADPTGPKYSISYNANGQDASYTGSPITATRAFSSWSKSGTGTWNSSTKVWTYGAGNGTLTASYSPSATFTLPAISKANYTCQWADGSASGTKYNGGTQVTISDSKTYFAVCTAYPSLTVNPNGGTWNSSTSSQTFYQAANTTKTISNPTASYSITYNANGQGASYSSSPTSVTRTFSSWSKSGDGSLSGTTYTFGSSNGTLTANYNSTSNSFTLPSITKSGNTCYWAKGSASGTRYAGGSALTLDDNTAFYAVCGISISNITNMQQMTSNICSFSSIGEGKTLTDTRDTETYTVKKLKDGKCWMTQNLRLKNYIVKSTDSDVTSNFTVPNSASGTANDAAYVYDSGKTDYGVYYSWYAATAGTGNTTLKNGTDAPSSICPKGWRLPTAYPYESSDFNLMRNQYGGVGNGLINGEPNYVLAGKRVNTTMSEVGDNGQYWSSTKYDSSSYNNYGRLFQITRIAGENFATGFYYYPMSTGLSVRCVAR